MKKKTLKGLIILILFAVAITFAFYFLFTKIEHEFHDFKTGDNEKILRVSYLNVGQGDSVLIQTPFGQNVIIDGGPDSKVLSELGSVLPWWDRDIDLMILSHPHSDHVTGLGYVIDSYNVGKILHTGVSHTAPSYIDWLKKIERDSIEMVVADKAQKIELGEDCYLEVLYPSENYLHKEIKNLNNASIVVRLVYGETSFLFAGDAEQEVEQELLGSGIHLKSNVFKLSHHGSNDSNTEEFLDRVDPEIVVIQVGINNEFHHPHKRVIRRLEQMKVRIFRNDLDGLVRIFSDGKQVYVD